MNTKRNTLMMFMSINSETLNCKHARMKKAVRSQREQKDVNCGSSVIHFVADVPTSPSLVQAGNKKKVSLLLQFHEHCWFVTRRRYPSSISTQSQEKTVLGRICCSLIQRCHSNFHRHLGEIFSPGLLY